MSRESRPRMRRAARIGALVEDVLHARGFEDKIREYRTWLIWDETVGPQIAARARPVRIRDGVLEIRVDQPVWMQQLQLMKPMLLGRLNDRLGGAVLRDLFLRQGKNAPVVPPPPPATAPAWLKVELDDNDRAEIESTLGSLDDPDLKEQLRRVLIRQKQLSKSKGSS